MYLYFISDNILFSNTSQMKWNNIEDVFLFSDNPTLQQYNNTTIQQYNNICFRTKYTSINKIYDSIEYLVTFETWLHQQFASWSVYGSHGTKW